MVRIELHIHTRFSKDSLLPLWVLYLVCKLKEIDCIAITDHNEIAGALKFQRRFKHMAVIVGEEISSCEGELIGLFLKEQIPAGMTAKETIAEIKSQGGLVYLPHPSDKMREKTVLPEPLFLSLCKDISVVESFNGRTLNKLDIQNQKRIANELVHSVPVAGSDAHTAFELGRTYMRADSIPRNCDDFLGEMMRAEMIASPCIRSAHIATKFAKGIKLLFKGDISSLFLKIFKAR